MESKVLQFARQTSGEVVIEKKSPRNLHRYPLESSDEY